MFVAARAARAGRLLRRELLDGRRRLRQPRALRAARLVARRHGRARSSARARSTRCTAAPPPTSPTPTSGARGCHGYSEHYADLRGRRVPRPGQADPLRRPDRLAGGAPHQAASPVGRDVRRGAPTRGPTAARRRRRPVPDELDVGVHRGGVAQPAVDAHDAGSDGGSTTAPTDLLAYQEIIAGVRPDWIIETGTGDGGRALFLASICELVGHGAGGLDRRARSRDDLPAPSAPALRHAAPAHDAATVARRCASIVGDGPGARRARLVRRPGHDRRAEFEAYAPLVPVGSYVVVADTIVNGHPVWPGVRPGPGRGGEADPRRATASSCRTRRWRSTRSRSTPEAS